MSQIELSEAMSERGKAGGLSSGKTRRSTASSTASVKNEPLLEAENGFGSSNKGIKEEKNELTKEEKKEQAIPLKAPPGFVEPGERWAAKMNAGLDKYGEMWKDAYIAKKRAKPVWVPGMLKYADYLTPFTDDQVRAGLKAFFQMEGKYVKNHDFTYFCMNTVRFINEGINPESETDIRATDQYLKEQEAKSGGSAP